MGVSGDERGLRLDTDPVFAEHDVEERCGAVLDVLCGENSDAPCLCVFAEVCVSQMLERVAVVLCLVPEVSFDVDNDARVDPEVVGAPETLDVVRDEVELALGVLAAREHLASHEADHSAVAAEREERVVARRAARGGVDHEEQVLGEVRRVRRQCKEPLDVLLPENALLAVEREPCKLRLDEIRAILHDDLESLVACARLPRGDEVQHVHALLGHPFGDAGSARQLDLRGVEDRAPCVLVLHFKEA